MVLADAAGRVRADPGQLEQVLMNLAVNARDAMPEGGTLTIETASMTIEGDYAATHLGVEPGPYVMLSRERYGRRHGRADLRTGLRAVLHDQGGG